MAGDGKIYLANERGVVTVLVANAEWTVLTAHDCGEPIMATPVIHDDAIYLRTENALYQFEQRTEASEPAIDAGGRAKE